MPNTLIGDEESPKFAGTQPMAVRRTSLCCTVITGYQFIGLAEEFEN